MTRQEAEDLLPWFVNGSLSHEESRAVQAFIDSGEISQQEVEEVRLFAETIQEQTAEEPAFNPAIFDGVMAKLDTVEQEVADTPLIVQEPHQESAGFFARLFGGFAWPPMAKLAVAGQFAVLVALSAALLTNSPEETVSETVYGSPSSGYEVDIQVIFAPTATEAQIRELLLSVEGVIVDGPSVNGIYHIDVADEFDTPETVQLLIANEHTLIVQEAAE